MNTEIVPRVYQKQVIQVALAGLNGRFRRALVVLATGLGKTLTSAMIAKKFKARRILFLVHNNFILEHAMSEFARIFDPEKVKMVIYNGFSKKGATEADIVFATWQTMGKNLDKWSPDYFNLIIVDEAHHAEAETYKPMIVYFTGAKLGITATPDREDEADIRQVFGDEVVNITLEEAIVSGWLPRIEYHVVTDESLDEFALKQIMMEIKNAKRGFSMAEVDRRVFIRKRNKEIAKIINSHKEKAVVFCSSIGHAERMRRALKNASTFHSAKGKNNKDTHKKNQKVLNALNKGTIRQICVVDAFNEGVNVPTVGLVAFCRVTQAATVFRQQLGRGLRPGKEKLIVLDFVGNLERIRLILEMVDRIKGFGEQTGNREKYNQERFDVSGSGFEFTFSDEVVNLIEILKRIKRDLYSTWQEASVAARKLGIKTSIEYIFRKRYKEDPKLPCNPHAVYSDFPGWPKFLRDAVEKYSTWQKASEQTRKLGIKSSTEYSKRYKEDPKLHRNPHTIYMDFPGWPVFLKGEDGKKELRKKRKDFYQRWPLAMVAVRRLRIKSHAEYKKRYKEDERLPSDPAIVYKKFPGWPVFLGKRTRRVLQEKSTSVK